MMLRILWWHRRPAFYRPIFRIKKREIKSKSLISQLFSTSILIWILKPYSNLGCLTVFAEQVKKYQSKEKKSLLSSHPCCAVKEWTEEFIAALFCRSVQLALRSSNKGLVDLMLILYTEDLILALSSHTNILDLHEEIV